MELKPLNIYGQKSKISQNDLDEIFFLQYNDLFSKLLQRSIEDFFSLLQKQVLFHLKIIDKQQDNSLISFFNEKYYDICKKDKLKIQNIYNILKSSPFHNFQTLDTLDIYIHCFQCTDAIHKCGNKLINYNDLYFCLTCQKVYNHNQIKLFCKECNRTYLTTKRSISDRKHEYFYSISFMNYHCYVENEEKMKCLNCGDDLYYNINNVKNEQNKIRDIYCIKCKLIFDTKKIFFKCKICGENFMGEPQIYRNFSSIKKYLLLLVHTFRKGIYAIPNPLTNKKCNCDLNGVLYFLHQDQGILYQGKKNGKNVIICDCCYGIFKPDNFNWNCPFCQRNFKTLIDYEYEMPNKSRRIIRKQRKVYVPNSNINIYKNFNKNDADNRHNNFFFNSIGHPSDNSRQLMQSVSFVHNRGLTLNNDEGQRRYLYLIDKNNNFNIHKSSNRIIFKPRNYRRNNEFNNNYSYDSKILKTENKNKRNLRHNNFNLRKIYLNKENNDFENPNLNNGKKYISFLNRSFYKNNVNNNINNEINNDINNTNYNYNYHLSPDANNKKYIEVPTQNKNIMKYSKSVNSVRNKENIEISETQNMTNRNIIEKGKEIKEKSPKNKESKKHGNNYIIIKSNAIQMNYTSNLSPNIKRINKNSDFENENKEKNLKLRNNKKSDIYQKKIMKDKNIKDKNNKNENHNPFKKQNIIKRKKITNKNIYITEYKNNNKSFNVNDNIYKNNNQNKTIKNELKHNIKEDIKDNNNTNLRNKKNINYISKSIILNKENEKNQEEKIINKNMVNNQSKFNNIKISEISDIKKDNKNENNLERCNIINNEIVLTNKNNDINNNNAVHISNTSKKKKNKKGNKESKNKDKSKYKDESPMDGNNKIKKDYLDNKKLNIHKKNLSVNINTLNNIKNELNLRNSENKDIIKKIKISLDKRINDNNINIKNNLYQNKDIITKNVNKEDNHVINNKEKSNLDVIKEIKENNIKEINSNESPQNNLINKNNKEKNNLNIIKENNIEDINTNKSPHKILIEKNNTNNVINDNNIDKNNINKSSNNILEHKYKYNISIINNNNKIEKNYNNENKKLNKLNNSTNVETQTNNKLNIIFNNKLNVTPIKNLCQSLNINMLNNLINDNNISKDPNDNSLQNNINNDKLNNTMNNKMSNNLLSKDYSNVIIKHEHPINNMIIQHDKKTNNNIYNTPNVKNSNVIEKSPKDNINNLNMHQINKILNINESLNNNNSNILSKSMNNNLMNNLHNINYNNIQNNINNNPINNNINHNYMLNNINSKNKNNININIPKNSNIQIKPNIMPDNDCHPKDNIKNINIYNSTNNNIIPPKTNNKIENDIILNDKIPEDTIKQNDNIIPINTNNKEKQNNNNNIVIKPQNKKNIIKDIENGYVIKLKIYFLQIGKLNNDNIKRRLSFDCRQSRNHFKLFNNEEHMEIKTFDSNYYKIISQIGKGTYGEIYLVQDPKTSTFYALKKIVITDALELRDNQEEYKLTWKLTHANPELKIAKKYAIELKKLDKYNLVMYILMEAANCDWEHELLNRQKVKAFYTEIELLTILKSLVYTLAILQKKGISHRDVKPQNILCFGNEGYKLTDFGEAKKRNQQMGIKNLYGFEQNTSKQTVRGTELYMSPILFRALHAKNVETVQYNAYKSDVFSLGMCFLLASSLNYQSLFEIREVLDMKIIEQVVNKYLGNLYSKNYIKLLISMLQVDEKLRPDFIELSSAFN